MKKLNSPTLSYKEYDPEMVKMFENYNRVLRAVGLFLIIQFVLLLAII